MNKRSDDITPYGMSLEVSVPPKKFIKKKQHILLTIQWYSWNIFWTSKNSWNEIYKRPTILISILIIIWQIYVSRGT
jgi:hypothetical protein